jgi:regulator of protease activity HflC (stomatin/prohibitin superfamily)
MWVYIVLAVIGVIVGLTVFKPRRVTVFDFQRGLAYRRGRFAGVLEPGVYWHLRFFTRISTVDARSQAVTVPGQEVLSSDGITIKVSLAASYRIADPSLYANQVRNADGALYIALQIAAREIIGGATIDDLLQRRAEFGKRLVELAAPEAEKLGLALESADLKDIMFPGPLKKVFAQEVEARKAGLAALERARGETAALRNLANAAKLLEKNPVLMQLRAVQSVGGTSGNTLVLGLSSQAAPLPIQGKALQAGDADPQEFGDESSPQ